jgi:hypothetical protein
LIRRGASSGPGVALSGAFGRDLDLLVNALDPSHVDAALWGNAADLYLRRPRGG